MEPDIIALAVGIQRDLEFNIETENTMNSSSETIQFMINQQNSEKWKSDKLSSTIIKTIKTHEQINEQMQRTSYADILAGVKFNFERHKTSEEKTEHSSKSKVTKEVENRYGLLVLNYSIPLISNALFSYTLIFFISKFHRLNILNKFTLVTFSRNSADIDFINIQENIPPHPHLTAGENKVR